MTDLVARREAHRVRRHRPMHAALREEIEATAEDRWQPYGEDSGAVKGWP